MWTSSRASRTCCAAVLLALTGALTASEAAERTEAIAYVRGSDRIAYRETDWVRNDGGARERLVLYRCPGGQPFARKIVRDDPSPFAPSFDFEDARSGYREGVRSEGGVRRVFVRSDRQAALDSRPLPPAPDAVLDAGFDAYVRAHWRELSGGDSHRIDFLIPSRFGYLTLKVSGARDLELWGSPARRLTLSLAAWYGFVLPAVELTYDRDGRRLEMFEGIGTVRDARGRNQAVRVEFAPAPATEVSDQEVESASHQSLVGQC